MITNAAQGIARSNTGEDSSTPPKTTPTKTHPPKYPNHHRTATPQQQPPILSPQNSSIPDDEYDSNNSAVATYPVPEYPMFLSNFNEDSYYPPHQQDLYFPYSDPELSQQGFLHSAPPQAALVHQQARPYSASSSSCSSSESEMHLHNLGQYDNNGQLQQFNITCFNNNGTTAGHAHNMGGYEGHDFKHQVAHHGATPAGYTSVIVDTQQYQLAHEYVH